jgi:hypothetical protein
MEPYLYNNIKYKYRTTRSLTSRLHESEWPASLPAPLPTGNNLRFPLRKEPAGQQSRPGGFGEEQNI